MTTETPDAWRRPGPTPEQAAAEQAVRDGDADAAVVSGPAVLAMNEAPDDVVSALSTAPRSGC